ncbi:inosine/xanthosine triphosphatase [Bacteroidota bacterium]
MKKVFIGSENPVKIVCTRQAFAKAFPEIKFEYVGLNVSSDVNHQPMTDKETREGSINRAKNARDKFPAGDFWVGIEGGIQKIDNDLHAFAWMVILNKTRTGIARTATFLLPPEIAELINQGMELGDADDKVFNRKNSKQEDGAVGILTDGLINRTQYYEHAMTLALIPFMKEDLFNPKIVY